MHPVIVYFVISVSIALDTATPVYDVKCVNYDFDVSIEGNTVGFALDYAQKQFYKQYREDPSLAPIENYDADAAMRDAGAHGYTFIAWTL